MSQRERVKRPKLDQTAPNRSWSTLFGVPGRGGGTTDSASTARPSRDNALGDVVAHSVDLGYRVIDEYIRQGQKAAQRFSDRSYGPDTVTTDTQELAARMAQYASDFTALWLEFMQLTAGNVGRWPTPFDGAGVAPSTSPAPTPPPARATAAATNTTADMRVKVAVSSPYPTEVSLDMRPDGGVRRLVVHALRAVDPEKPRLTDIAIGEAAPGEPVTLRIRVPVGQPAGVYNGLIVEEETSRPVGTVSLRITPE